MRKFIPKEKLVGGVYLHEYKDISTNKDIVKLSIPQYIYVPLVGYNGINLTVIVSVGEKVLKYQQLAITNEYLGVYVHAPTSGEVISIVDNHSIVIKTDQLDDCIDINPIDYTTLNKEQLISVVKHSGIIGLGGAGFPTHAKLDTKGKPVNYLIINAVECEPCITADDMLMREFSQDLMQGIMVIDKILNPTHIIIAIEDNKTIAIQKLHEAFQVIQNIDIKNKIELAVLETKYPSGSAKQLVKMLLGIEIKSGMRSINQGIVCHNVGTILAIKQAFAGMPLVERITTITGDLPNPQNVKVLVGTKVSDLLKLTDNMISNDVSLVAGGPMMGISCTLEDTINKTSQCVIAINRSQQVQTLPCIRCSQCEIHCPMGLLPQQMHFFARADEYKHLENLNLFDCIECAVCSYVCPSNIDLVSYFKIAKTEISYNRSKEQKSLKSQQRFEARQQRLGYEQKQKESARLARMTDKTNTSNIEKSKTTSTESDTQALIKVLKVKISSNKVAISKIQKQLEQDNNNLDLQNSLTKMQSALSDLQSQKEQLEYNVSIHASVDNAPIKQESTGIENIVEKKIRIKLATKKIAFNKAKKQLELNKDNNKLEHSLLVLETEIKELETRLTNNVR